MSGARESGAAAAGDGVRVEQLVGGAPRARPGRRRGRGAAPASVLAALGLVALVAALSGGLPDRVHGGGGGLSAAALAGDAAAVVLVVAIAGLAVALYADWAGRGRGRRLRLRRRRRPRLRLPRLDPRQLAVPLLVAAGVAFLLGALALLAGGGRRGRTTLVAPLSAGNPAHHVARGAAGGAGPSIDPAAVIAAAAIVLVGVAVFTLRARRRRGAGAGGEQPLDGLVAALDGSLEELAAEADPRRAVIRAYDRMERALAASGTPRGRAETPVEYLRRALAAVSASQASVARLTDLFERARFSIHAIDGAMKREAIAAVSALRAELEGPGAGAGRTAP